LAFNKYPSFKLFLLDTFDTKSRSRQPGNDAVATTEEVLSIGNSQLARAKTRSTITSAQAVGINNRSDTQNSTKSKPTS